jgi:hypothetical protein
VALAATTTKTVNGILAAANIAVKGLEFAASFDGATSTNAPVVVDFARCTFATNQPGTNSSATTLQKRDPGRAETLQTSGGNTWTTEPTVVTPQFSRDVAQYDGSYHYICPQTSPMIIVGGKGFVIRCTSPNIVNRTSSITAEE